MYDVLPTRTVGTGADAGVADRRSEGESRHVADCSDRDETWVGAGVER